jgi:hypothetical protein
MTWASPKFYQALTYSNLGISRTGQTFAPFQYRSLSDARPIPIAYQHLVGLFISYSPVWRSLAGINGTIIHLDLSQFWVRNSEIERNYTYTRHQKGSVIGYCMCFSTTARECGEYMGPCGRSPADEFDHWWDLLRIPSSSIPNGIDFIYGLFRSNRNKVGEYSSTRALWCNGSTGTPRNFSGHSHSDSAPKFSWEWTKWYNPSENIFYNNICSTQVIRRCRYSGILWPFCPWTTISYVNCLLKKMGVQNKQSDQRKSQIWGPQFSPSLVEMPSSFVEIQMGGT